MDNRKTAGSIQLLLTLIALLFLAAFICSQVVPVMMTPEIKWGSGILTALAFYYFMTGGFYYIELNNADDHLEVKFYNTFPFNRSFKMYKIPISAFIKYETTGSKFYKRKLFLYQMSANQMAKYPPIYISALSKKDEANMAQFFKNLKSK
ncbi:hypothetical protein [Plebeiibacterium sediminum]|uniref:Uncharacterized protein n=1 Tax=Plebeiibacterium sediminum TaxID=2992112 RepID=A0AAE3M4W5_9BACT|nr:hypothetical protein [Plebeiobacterium sediminum]MCW3787184.1 hypothetical protein [Plebeiobacterium sediminum]